MQLSPHFTLEELCRSSKAKKYGIPNKPSDKRIIQALKNLCNDVLEPIRKRVGLPLSVNSGYRSPELNHRVKGSKISQHLVGEAADIECPKFANGDNLMLAIEIERCFEKGTMKKYNQLILEYYNSTLTGSGWIHIGYRKNGVNRGEKLIIGGEFAERGQAKRIVKSFSSLLDQRDGNDLDKNRKQGHKSDDQHIPEEREKSTTEKSREDLLKLTTPYMKNERVEQVQRRLAALAYLRQSGVDGIYGSNTKLAVQAFQREHRLAADGIVGKETRAALRGLMERVQQRLVSLGYLRKMDVGGPYVPNTQNAVRGFQRNSQGLQYDGIAGPKTREKLF